MSLWPRRGGHHRDDQNQDSETESVTDPVTDLETDQETNQETDLECDDPVEETHTQTQDVPQARHGRHHGRHRSDQSVDRTSDHTTDTDTTDPGTATDTTDSSRPAPTPIFTPKPVPTPVSTVHPSGGTAVDVKLTFYGSPDNDPPGGAIAYPSIHDLAGGTGTFSDPITFASATGWMPKGTKIYYAPLKRYFIMEDECVSAESAWAQDKTKWVDLWVGYSVGDDQAILAGEDRLTPNGPVPILVDPPDGLPVTAGPLIGKTSR